MINVFLDRVFLRGDHHYCCDEEKWKFQTLYRIHRLEHGNHHIDELLEKLHGDSWSSKVVLSSGYHQIVIVEEYVQNVGFRVRCEFYEFW